jgi:hypothetical protein
MNIKLVGITGKHGVGKDTAAKFLCDTLLYTKYSLADPLKKGVKEIFNFSDDQLWGNAKDIVSPFWGVSPREVLQKFGTDIIRNRIKDVIPALKDIGDNFWVLRFNLWYRSFIDENPMGKVVISDVRFKNEALAVKTYSGIIIKIVRKLDYEEDTHISETEMDNIKEDILIENNGTIEALNIQLNDKIRGYTKKQ